MKGKRGHLPQGQESTEQSVEVRRLRSLLLNARLCIRAGRVGEAEELLRKIEQGLPDAKRWDGSQVGK